MIRYIHGFTVALKDERNVAEFFFAEKRKEKRKRDDTNVEATTLTRTDTCIYHLLLRTLEVNHKCGRMNT